MLSFVQVLFYNPQTLRTTSNWLKRSFFAEKQIFYFVSTVFSKILVRKIDFPLTSLAVLILKYISIYLRTHISISTYPYIYTYLPIYLYLRTHISIQVIHLSHSQGNHSLVQQHQRKAELQVHTVGQKRNLPFHL